MEEYGVFEAAGTLGYHSAHIALRAPRVAIRVEARDHWQSMFALAMSTASGLWGGYGFIYLPRVGELHPALARVLTAYDPDYLVDAPWTHGDMEALEPGWHAGHVQDWPADRDEAAARLASCAEQDVGYYNDDPWTNLCSPYYEPHGSRWTVLSARESGPLRALATVVGSTQQATFEVPEGLDPLLMLTLGMRAGFPTKPPLPLGREVNGVDDRLPQRFVDYAVASRRDRTVLQFGSNLVTAWSLTQIGLVPISRARPRPRPVVVIGSTAEDFALAVALDRMYGPVLWVPVEWTRDASLRSSVQHGYGDALDAAHRTGHPPIVTSISLPEEQLHEAVRASWPEPIHLKVNGVALPQDRNLPEVMPAEKLDLHAPTHLACEGDYDLSFTSATRADGHGGFEFTLPVPVHTPRSEHLRGPQRPFWEVDVQVINAAMPTGRNLPAQSILADGDPYPTTVLRSGRDGISFYPETMDFVPSGATLEQSIAKLRLRMLDLRRWIEALAAQNKPDMQVRLSQAGRRAMILTRLWGSRSAVARDLLDLNDFLREFTRPGSSDPEAYPEGDGVRLTPNEGYLTLAAAHRTLPGMASGEIRERLNHLLGINVLQRGLIVPCSECERRAFYRIDLLSETNTCPRCGAPAHVTAAWRSKHNEPEWFYDLHGAARELLEQNGDVPFLAGRALANRARRVEDIAEIDFCRPDEDPAEIDIAALVDGRLTIGEAKISPELGTRRETAKSIAKLLDASDLLGADEILLATTHPGPWKERDIDQLKKEVAHRKWRFGKVPQVTVRENLRDTHPISLALPPALRTPADEPALDLLRAYYQHDSTEPAGRDYTGGLFDTWAKPDGVDPSPDVFSTDDLVAVTFLSVHVPGRAAALLLDAQAEYFNGILAEIGPDRDLIDEPAGQITAEWPAWRLHDQLRTLPGVDWVIAGKLLARKRPRLVPVYDRVVRGVVGHPKHYWVALQHALFRDERALHHRLIRLRDLADVPAQVSALRVFDVVAWMTGRPSE